MTEQILSPLLEDRAITKQEVARAVSIGTPIVEGSNLVNESGQLGKGDVERTKKLIQAIAPIDISNYKVHAHLQLTSEFAIRIGEELKGNDPEKYADLNLDELEILGLLHDIGRFFTHRWLRNELVEKYFLKKLGIRQDLIDKIQSVKIFVSKDPNDPKEAAETTKNLTLTQKIIEMADICGKRKPDGGISTFEEIMEYHRKSRSDYQALSGLDPLWASERKLNRNVVEFSEKVYRAIHQEFGDNGVDLEKIRNDILTQEKESSIKAVIFDVGNVLIPYSDSEILSSLESTFDIDSETTISAWNRLIPPLQEGKITEEEFWKQFRELVNRPQVLGHESLLTNSLAQKVIPEVKKIVEEVKQRGFRVAALSDTISPHAKALENSGIYDEFPDRIFSYDIKTNKKRDEAFIIAALRLGLPPQACLFIDDRKEYVERAQKIGMKGVVFQNPQQLEQDLQNQSII